MFVAIAAYSFGNERVTYNEIDDRSPKPKGLSKSAQWYSLGEIASQYASIDFEYLKDFADYFGLSLRDLGSFKDTAKKVERYAQLHFEMRRLKEEMQPIIEMTKRDGAHPIIDEFLSESGKITLVPNEDGMGGAYFAKKGQESLYVVKPVDEDIGAYNNRKGVAFTYSIYDSLAAEFSIYKAPLNDLMMYDLASMLGIQESVPETAMVIVENEGFYDQFQDSEESIKRLAIEAGAGPDNEKLCTVQRFVKGSKTLVETWHDILADGKGSFDQESFENLNILFWLSSETDGHMGNVLATVKGIDAEGNKIYALKKIDSSFSFPKKTDYWGNATVFLPDGQKKLSERAKQLIRTIDPDQIVKRMDQLGYDKEHQSAMLERVERLKKLAKEKLTVRDIDQQLGKKDEKESDEHPLSNSDLWDHSRSLCYGGQ